MTSRPMIKLVSVLCASCLAFSSHQSFAVVSGGLTARVHPDSPRGCEVSVIEIGADVDGSWQPELALAYDTREGLARVRKVYGYFARPDSGEPPAVLNVDTVDRHVGFYLAYRIIKGIISLGIATAGATIGVDRFAVQPYLTNSKVQVAKPIETIRDYTETPAFSVPQDLHVSLDDFRDELKRVLMAGENILTVQKLFVDRTLAPKAWDWSAQTLRAQADRNDTRLSFVLERAGLKGLRRERWGDHFAVLKWHRDELLDIANFLDLVHLDVDTKTIPDRPLTEEEKEEVRHALAQMAANADADGYVTVAIYDLMNSGSDKVKVYDGISGPSALAWRKYAQLFRSIGLDFGGTLLSFLPKVLMNIASGGIDLTYNKVGVMFPYDQLEEDEAALFAALNGHLGYVTADERERLRIEAALDKQNINAFVRLEGDAHANRIANAELMTTYLKSRPQEFCDEINRARERDFRNEYLTRAERVGLDVKQVVAWLPGAAETDDPQQQAALIKERLPAVHARRTLRLYDPSKYGSPRAPEVRAALNTLAALHDSDDVTILGQVLHRTSEPSVMTSALDAMATHGDVALSEPIADWLGTIAPRSRYGMSSVVGTALRALTALRWSTYSPASDTRFVAVLEGLAPFVEDGSETNRELAIQVQAVILERLSQWRAQATQSVQSP